MGPTYSHKNAFSDLLSSDLRQKTQQFLHLWAGR